jgi:hypothetical protein
MPKKKKRRQTQERATARADILKQEVAEELLAIEAIYEEDFGLHKDGVVRGTAPPCCRAIHAIV